MWQSADGLIERTQNIFMLSLIPIYKDEPSAHGRCELEARRSVHPERMQVGALTSIWQVGVPPAEAQGVDSANSLFYKKVRSNILPSFLLIHIVDSTFHHSTSGWIRDNGLSRMPANP